jgi:hypothetical protein
MKNSINAITTPLFLFILLIFNSCSKSIEVNQISQNVVRTKIIDKIVTDSNFYELLYVYITKSQMIMKDTNNTYIIENGNAAMNVALTNFLVHNRDFVFTSQNERLIILKSVCDSFKSNAPFLQKPNNQIKELIEKLNTTNNNNKILRTYSNASNKKVVQKINTEDIIECAAGALIGGIGNYGEIYNDVRSIFRSGVSLGLAIDLTLDLIKNASPWWKVASIVLTFGSCLYFNS